ncbi:tRNA pseudouridine(65) synthase TruC [Aliiglaciecola lipolytica]|uniref:tRNA pseudouridine synthase C n=1 Tax=Aliiglaciecola lipolytica E3 TaxID=1127673 RepID=K6YSU4_9ALTE|nr:tRNA pseudouridine(65) synthase TruC [Aliiglaciecola lipolytica]GAC14350.1 tRNA pseudouridine65 synthase [Aliiglaciecola lipolytica E3]
MHLDILYQDEYIVAVDKPAGLLVHRSMIDRHETQFAMQLLRDQLGQHVFPVHRLDKPTSGVLLFALSSEIAKTLNQQFADKHVSKTYFAIVRGYSPEAGQIDYPLKEKLDKIADKKAQQDKPAQDAVTDYQCLQQFELPFAVGRYQTSRFSLVKLQPLTGRKHQLRRHMAHIRHPILGDTTHGDGKQNAFLRHQFNLQGLALSCSEMVISHPVTQLRLKLAAQFDIRLAVLLEQWGLSLKQIQNLTNLNND